MDREVGKSKIEGFEEFIVKEGCALEEPGEDHRMGLSAELTSELNMGIIPLKYDKVFYAQDFALICYVEGKRLRVDILPLEGYSGKALPFLEPEILFSSNIAKEIIFLKYKTTDRLICSLVVPLMTGTVCQIFLDEEGFIYSKRRTPMIVEFNLRRSEELEAAGTGLKMMEELSVKANETELQVKLVVAAVFEDDRIHLFELPLEYNLQSDYYLKAVDVEGVEVSLTRIGMFQALSSFTTSIFSSGRKQAPTPARSTIESIRYIGKYLLCVIENNDGDFEAKIINVANSETIARRKLPFITFEFEYQVRSSHQIGSIDLDPSSVHQDSVAVSLIFAAVFKDKNRIWNLYTSPNSEVIIWKLCFRAPQGRIRFKEIEVDDANHFSSSKSLLEVTSESLHFPSSVVTGLNISNDYLALHTYNIVEFRNEVFCYQLSLVGYNRMCVFTRDDMLTVLLLEDFTASAWGMGLDVQAYLRLRLFQSARFSIEVLKHVIVAYFENCTKIARGRLGSLACVRRLDELEEALDAVMSENLSISMDYMKLIRECTALELSAIISHFGLDPDCLHPPIIVRDNKSVSLLLKTSGYTNLRNTVSFIHYKKFVRFNIQHYLSLREPTLYIRNNYSTDIVEKVAERVKNIERNHLKVDFGIEPAVSDFNSSSEDQAFLGYLLQLRSILTEAGDMNSFFEVHWAVLAVMVSSAALNQQSVKNLKATISFIFDLLLTKVSLFEVDLLRQTYLNDKELIDTKMSYLVSDYFEHRRSGDKVLPSVQQSADIPLTDNFVQAAALNLASNLAASSAHFLLILFHRHVNRLQATEDPLIDHLTATTTADLFLQRLADSKELVRLVSASSPLREASRKNTLGFESLLSDCLEHLYSQPCTNLSLLYFVHSKTPTRWLEFSRLLYRSDPAINYCNALALVHQGVGSFAQAQREFFRCVTQYYRTLLDDEEEVEAGFRRGPWYYLSPRSDPAEDALSFMVRGEELWLLLFKNLEFTHPEFLASIAQAVCEQAQVHIDIQKLYYKVLVEHSIKRSDPQLPICPPPQKDERRLFEYLSHSISPSHLPRFTPQLVLHKDYRQLRSEILRSIKPDLGNLQRTRDAAFSLYKGDYLRRDFEQVVSASAVLPRPAVRLPQVRRPLDQVPRDLQLPAQERRPAGDGRPGQPPRGTARALRRGRQAEPAEQLRPRVRETAERSRPRGLPQVRRLRDGRDRFADPRDDRRPELDAGPVPGALRQAAERGRLSEAAARADAAAAADDRSGSAVRLSVRASRLSAADAGLGAGAQALPGRPLRPHPRRGLPGHPRALQTHGRPRREPQAGLPGLPALQRQGPPVAQGLPRLHAPAAGGSAARVRDPSARLRLRRGSGPRALPPARPEPTARPAVRKQLGRRPQTEKRHLRGRAGRGQGRLG